MIVNYFFTFFCFGIPIELVLANIETMKKIIDINNLAELLNSLQTEAMPVLIQLCSGCGNESFLMDEVVRKVQLEYGEELGYQKLLGSVSKFIKEELMAIKNPVLLLIEGGNIVAVFSGIISQHKLSQALKNLKETDLNET